MHRRPTTIVWGSIIALHLLTAALFLTGHTTGLLSYALLGAAYTRGLIHAFDADHLSMIDNSNRLFLTRGRTPRGVGLAFSLGHSTVVIAASAATIAGSHWIHQAITDGTTTALTLATIGATVSAAYLLCVAAANLPLALGHTNTTSPTGPISRLLATPMRHIRHEGHVLGFGILFGLGFDTASTLSLLILTATGATAGISSWTLMALPLAFTAAMTLGDTINSTLMLRAHQNADHHHRYTRTLATISIASAALVASITITGLLNDLAGTHLTWANTPAEPIAAALLATAILGALILHTPRQQPTTDPHTRRPAHHRSIVSRHHHG